MTRPQTLRIRGLDDLHTLVPHLLGFHPTGSLVLIGLRGERSRIVVTVRVDLPGTDDSLEEALAGAATGVQGLERVEADEVLLVVYPRAEDDPWARGVSPGPMPHEHLLGELADLLAELGIRIRDMVCVGADRQRSYLCTNLECCPPGGRALRDDLATVVDATMVATGSAPLPGRESLAEQLAPREEDDPVLRGVRRASERVYIRLTAGLIERTDRFVTDLRQLERVPRDQAARTRLVATAGHLVATVPGRDLLLRGLTVEADRALLALGRDVLAEAVRCSEPAVTAPLAATLAVCCWVDGDGAAAWAALDRAFDADPDHSLAHLVATALHQGQPPWIWTSIMAELTAEELVAGGRAGQERSPA